MTRTTRGEFKPAPNPSTENVSETVMLELMKEVINLSELIKEVIPVYDFADPHDKERVVRNIFSELFIAQDMVKYKVKNGLEGLVDHESAICEPLRVEPRTASSGTISPSEAIILRYCVDSVQKNVKDHPVDVPKLAKDLLKAIYL